MADATGVLGMQIGLSNGSAAASAESKATDSLSPGGAARAAAAGIVDGTPRALAAMILGALITLIALRAMGFRFSFGVNVGGG